MTIYDLYHAAWKQLGQDRQTLGEIEREATPVLAFGQWSTSKVVTAGLNPSEDEFRDKQRQPFVDDKQRFLHWPSDDQLTDERIYTAFERSNEYFTRGNAYTQWFSLYTSFLSGLGVGLSDGTACHTDYLSPFATQQGIARCTPRTRHQLAAFGLPFWKQLLPQFPQIQVVFGHGSGWRWMPELLGFQTWQSLATPFDDKGGRTTISKPYLLYQSIQLPPAGQSIAVYWWKPNRDGSPLTWLNAIERYELGQFVRQHAATRGLSL